MQYCNISTLYYFIVMMLFKLKDFYFNVNVTDMFSFFRFADCTHNVLIKTPDSN